MTFIITLLLKASICLLLSAFLLFLFRKASASLRHWIISLSLVGLLVLPFSSNYMPRWEVETPLALVEQQLPSPPKTKALSTLTPSVSEIQQAATGEDINTTNSAQLPPTQPLITSPNSLFTWPIFVFAIWFSISLFFLVRLYRGIRQTNRLRAESLPFKGPTRLNTDIPIRCHPAIRSPMTYGIRRPIILLPSVAKNWSAETLEIVLLHEMTHIKRRDYAVHLISWISLSLYWFHPLVWWFKRLQAIEREKACDEYVLRSGLAKERYAEQLVKVARALSPIHRTLSGYALPMAKSTQIKGRILSILKFKGSSFRFSSLRQWQWAGCYVVLILTLASFTPVQPVALMERVATDHPLTQLLQAEEETRRTETISTASTIASANYPAKVATEVKSDVRSDNMPKLSSLTLPLTPASLIPEKLAGAVRPISISPLPLPKAATSKREIGGAYSEWHQGKSRFRIWTIGHYDMSLDHPYLAVNAQNGLVIVEETRKTLLGTKSYQMVIARAPHEGGLVVEFNNSIPNAWNGGYKTGDPLHLFFINGKWEYLGRERNRWLEKQLPTVVDHLIHTPPDQQSWMHISSTHPVFKKYRNITQKRFKAYRDLPSHELIQHTQQKQVSKEEHPPFDFSSVPVLATPQPPSATQEGAKEWGGFRLGKAHSGGNSIPIGQKFGRIIRGIPSGTLLKDFNFYLRYNDFEELNFDLSLYQIDGNGIKHALTASPIPIEATEANWISKELAAQQINLEGDVLVIIELKEKAGAKGKGNIFFALAEGDYNSFHDQTGRDWGFWEGNFAFYVTVD